MASGTIAAHYIKFVIIIAVIGIAIGSAAGTWLGMSVTRLFGDFFRFPFLVFTYSPDVYIAAAMLSLAGRDCRCNPRASGCCQAASRGCHAAARSAALPPGAACRHSPSTASSRSPAMMMLRNIARHPIRAGFTMLGMALATAILVVSLFTSDTMEQLIDVTYFLADRQDATVSFIEKRPREVVLQVARLPGVLAVEPYREVPVRIRNGSIERRIMISGRPRDADLNRVIDVDLRPVVLPDVGLAISRMLAQILGVHVGDFVEVDLLEGQRRTVSLPVTALVEDYFGIRGMMDARRLGAADA